MPSGPDASLRPSAQIQEQAQRSQRRQSFVALIGAFGALCLIMLARTMIRTDSADDALARFVRGVGLVVLGAAVVLGLVLGLRILTRRAFRLRNGTRGGTTVEVVKNPVLTTLSKLQGFEGRMPIFLTLLADDAGIEIWGGLVGSRKVWSENWASVRQVRVGVQADGPQSYECLEFEFSDVGTPVLPLIVTGRGVGGLAAIEGRRLAELCAELGELGPGKTIGLRA